MVPHEGITHSEWVAKHVALLGDALKLLLQTLDLAPLVRFRLDLRRIGAVFFSASYKGYEWELPEITPQIHLLQTGNSLTFDMQQDWF